METAVHVPHPSPVLDLARHAHLVGTSGPDDSVSGTPFVEVLM